MHLDQLFDEFTLAHEAEHVSPRTLEDYGWRWKRFRRWLDASGTPPQSEAVSARLIQRWLSDALARYAPKTVDGDLRFLKSVWNWAVNDEAMREAGIVTDPTKRIPYVKLPQHAIAPLTSAQVERLLKACNLRSTWGARDFALLLLLYDTGIRVSELVGAAVRDFDPQARQLSVFGKGRKDRQVPLSAKTLRAMLRWRRVRERAGLGWEGPLFRSAQGGALTRNGVDQLLKRLGGRAGVAGVHAHRLRHSFAVTALRNGAREYDIQDILGHTTLLMTKRYVQVQQGAQLVEQHKRFSPAECLRTRG